MTKGAKSTAIVTIMELAKPASPLTIHSPRISQSPMDKGIGERPPACLAGSRTNEIRHESLDLTEGVGTP